MTERFLSQKMRDEIQKDKAVIAVLLFGSYARGEHYQDIDLCFVLDKKYTSKEMAKKAVYYATLLPSTFDVSIFQQLPLYIRQRVLKEGEVLVCKNAPLLYDIAYSTIKEFNLYEKSYRLYLDTLLEREAEHARQR